MGMVHILLWTHVTQPNATLNLISTDTNACTLARVLVGDYTQGKQGLPVPPAKSFKSVDLYNSVTNNMNNPTMFVIFNDVQAYPEYLITFQQGRAGANIHPRKNPFHPAYNFLW